MLKLFYGIIISVSLSFLIYADRGDEYIHTITDINSELISAAEKGNIGQVIQLIENKADINYNKNGLTPLIAAVKNNRKKIVSALLEAGAKVNVKDNSGNTALIIASMKGYTDIVEMLIKAKGINIGQVNNNGNSAEDIALNICKNRENMENFCTIKKLLAEASINKNGHNWIDGKIRR